MRLSVSSAQFPAVIRATADWGPAHAEDRKGTKYAAYEVNDAFSPDDVEINSSNKPHAYYNNPSDEKSRL
jgi:hypothetical protein